MKNKILAIFGIVAYILSVLSSAEDLKGNSIAPSVLIIISGIVTLVFFIMAVIRLWKEVRNLSIIFFSSAIILFILTIIQVVTSPSYGSPVIILTNVARIIYFIVFILVIIKLFKIKGVGTS